MENNSISITKHTIKYGIIQALLTLVLAITDYLNPNFTKWDKFFWMEIVIYLGPVFFGIKAYKFANNGFLKFSDAIKIGTGIFLLSSIALLISQVFITIFVEANNLENESYKGKIILDTPEISPKEVLKKVEDDRTISFIPFFWQLFMLVLRISMGTCISIVIGAFMYRKKKL